MRSPFFTQVRSVLAFAILVAVGGTLVACQPRHVERDPWTSDAVQLTVRASDTQVLAGQIVVLTADARNVLGRDAQVEWDAPGGEVETDQGGRIARVKFNRPGTYVVTSRLYVDDEIHHSETTRITVRPVN